jgi:hypothetical protein
MIMTRKPIKPSHNPSGRGEFKDPIAPKKREDGAYPFEFKAPTYDNRTSCSISAGNDYGVGFTQPVGKEAASPITSGPILQQAKCFSPYEIFENQDCKG